LTEFAAAVRAVVSERSYTWTSGYASTKALKRLLHGCQLCAMQQAHVPP
jgi:hypothetical protein